MSSTPRIDAVKRWLAAGRVGQIEWPPEPPEWQTEWQIEHLRLIACLRMAASGAPAILPAPRQEKRPIPPPPRRTKRRGRPRTAPTGASA